jgi:hypothetical protein
MEAFQVRAAEIAIEKMQRRLMSHPNTRIMQRLALVLIIVTLSVLVYRFRHNEAHQDPCHRLHRCPSDRNTYIC